MGVSSASAQVASVDVARLTASAVGADHRALANHYRAHAIEHDADAARHDTLAAEAKARPSDDDAWDLARDAAHYAQHSREAAEALRDLAQLHDAIADRLDSGTASIPPAKSCCGKGMAGKKDTRTPAAPAPKREHVEH
jgi:hypothetical protein